MDVDAEPPRKLNPETETRISIEDAVQQFLRDEAARQLAKTTTCQSKTLFERQLLSWIRTEGLSFLDELTTANLRQFRASWKNNALNPEEAPSAKFVFRFLHRE